MAFGCRRHTQERVRLRHRQRNVAASGTNSQLPPPELSQVDTLIEASGRTPSHACANVPTLWLTRGRSMSKEYSKCCRGFRFKYEDYLPEGSAASASSLMRSTE